MTTSLIVCGALGRMGQAVIELALGNKDFHISAGIVRPDTVVQQHKIYPFPIFDQLEKALFSINASYGNHVLMDFSNESLLSQHLKIAKKYRLGYMIGTTDHHEKNFLTINEVKNDIPIVFAPNTSVMANLLISFSKIAASILDDADAYILDIHHSEKKDAPSGTAKALQEAIASEQNKTSKVGKILTQSLRVGKVAGEHTVSFFSDFERLEFTHRVLDRKVFAQGALVVAQFLSNRQPGLYYMNDVLNLKLTIEK
jgi:4-hydroxy-tetrahydrodipicolinate reductase